MIDRMVLTVIDVDGYHSLLSTKCIAFVYALLEIAIAIRSLGLVFMHKNGRLASLVELYPSWLGEAYGHQISTSLQVKQNPNLPELL